MMGAVLTGCALLVSGVLMGRYLTIAALVFSALTIGVIVLFVVQNGARTTQLSLDLGFAAWQLQQPMQVPALIGIAFGSGLVLGALPLWLRGIAQRRRVRELERQVALSTDGSERPW